ncbi:MAG: hypothetical protein GY805_27010 [Chloroflexi bacterium]|nr:hypothetical protein [Chloroflexota bacterium]
MRQLNLFPPEILLQNGRIHGSLPKNIPIIVSNGVGVDSVALLIELHRLNIVPDAIVTALVGREWFGNEHRRFYKYLPILEQWLAEVGFPPITYVWYEMKRQANCFEYWSLAGNCLANRTLPSISFRRHHSCSLKYKGAEIDRWVTEKYGEWPCYRLVGYDLSEGYRVARFSTKAKRKSPRSNDVYVYPLQLLGLDRTGCNTVIESAGLPSPGLSSCVFCAAMHPEEIDELHYASHLEELWLIVILEAHAQINLKKIRGLWGHGERMTEYILRRGLLPAALVAEVWAKWSARERPSELRNHPEAVADVVLFNEVRQLAALCAAQGEHVANATHTVRSV